MLRGQVTCVTCGVSQPRDAFQLGTKRLSNKCVGCRTKATIIKEPKILTSVKEIFLHVMEHVQGVKSVLSCAVTKSTAQWLQDEGLWQALVRRDCLFDTRSLPAARNWLLTYMHQYKRGFYFTYDNEHEETPRINVVWIDQPTSGWYLQIDGISTMYLPWPYNTTEFWLEPLNNKASWNLKSDKIAEALNSGNLETLCNDDLIKHVAQIFPSGKYNVAFRTATPHWFEGDDGRNYFRNQHYKFGNRDKKDCPLVNGFYQTFWEKPQFPVTYPLVSDVETSPTFDVPGALFELIIPLQDRERLNQQRVEFYKKEILSGATPTVLAFGKLDDRKTIPYLDPHHARSYYEKYDRLCTAVTFIVDGHHKIEAAAQLKRPVRMMCYYYDPCTTKIFDKLIMETSPKPLDYMPVAFPVPSDSKTPKFPPILLSCLYDPRPSGHSETCNKVTESLVVSLLIVSLPVFMGSYRYKVPPLDSLIKHFVFDGKKCYVWAKNKDSFVMLSLTGIAIHPESVKEGLFEEPPQLPSNPAEYYVPPEPIIPRSDSL